MRQLFGLAIFTKKEVMQLLVEEKRTSYRKGYKAGAAMRYRREKISPIAIPPENVQPTPNLVDDLLTVIRTGSLPESYGDSLPLKESGETLTSEK